ncbi:hypothetical protein [Rhizobium oryzicola]|uniref:Uncharacterized protein n=1 Tax=Rhizobium oryzicola TaxID=1232668 RepID=A0ABT8SXR5_9HYPH|nr:hypothetical protein [Rhizobium oryzicola]MDO1582427.1 hypothetical protein [Rhizobium oryzicola]
MTPQEAIAALDKDIAAYGQPVTLKRGALSVETRAFVRGYKPAELIGGLKQGDSAVIFSPTGLKDWPDMKLKNGDQFVTAGKTRNIEIADPVYMGSTLVRANVTVRG